MPYYRPGGYVCVKEARVGLVRKVQNSLNVLVQFGTDGPFEWWSMHSLRPATPEEIAYTTGERLPPLRIRADSVAALQATRTKYYAKHLKAQRKRQ